MHSVHQDATTGNKSRDRGWLPGEIQVRAFTALPGFCRSPDNC